MLFTAKTAYYQCHLISVVNSNCSVPEETPNLTGPPIKMWKPLNICFWFWWGLLVCFGFCFLWFFGVGVGVFGLVWFFGVFCRKPL